MCLHFTEPGAGSDPGSMITRATADGDYYVLNGRKCFISGAPIADYAIVYARTNPELKGAKGISMFIVDMHLDGVSVENQNLRWELTVIRQVILFLRMSVYIRVIC